jgi:hypothetical protein
MSEDLIFQRDYYRKQLAVKDAKIHELREKLAKLEVRPHTSNLFLTTQSPQSNIKDSFAFFKSLTKQKRNVWECAVSCTWLQSFVKKREKLLQGFSTLDVVTKIIIPETSIKKVRYADLIPDIHLSVPTFFISHVWTAPFLDLVGAIRQHLGEQKNVFLWIDIFAISQHKSKEQVDDLKNLHIAVKQSTQGTLVCMDENGKLLTRFVCDMYVAKNAGFGVFLRFGRHLDSA